MRKKWIAMIGSGILVTGLAVAGASFAESGDSEVRNGTIRVEDKMEAEFPALAKITWQQAVQKALTDVPGQVLNTKLEDENGFLVYDVEVVTADNLNLEVKVDAGNGKVLSTGQDENDEDKYGGFWDRFESKKDNDNDSDSED